MELGAGGAREVVEAIHHSAEGRVHRPRLQSLPITVLFVSTPVGATCDQGSGFAVSRDQLPVPRQALVKGSGRARVQGGVGQSTAPGNGWLEASIWFFFFAVIYTLFSAIGERTATWVCACGCLWKAKGRVVNGRKWLPLLLLVMRDVISCG